MILFANAKINLGLHILGRRADGFHNLETVFYPVPLYDVIEFHPSDRFDLHLYGEKIEGEREENLVTKAFRLMQNRFSVPGLEIHLMKNIPAGSGLGGGSSDAAHLLTAMNRFFRLDLSHDQLRQLAGMLGSDCPFFIENKPRFASGKGDIFEEVSLDLTDHFLVLVFPEVRIATQKAYALLGEIPERQTGLKETIEMPPETWKSNIVNDFEKVIFPEFPELAEYKNALLELGALYASLTGSGSAVFGIFRAKPDLSNRFRGLPYRIFRL